MRIPSHIKFGNNQLQEAFEALEKGSYQEQQLHKQLINAFLLLEENAFNGIKIPKKLIPKTYQVNNLWKRNLPNGWRLLYTIAQEEVIILSIILEWVNHKKYEKRFKY